MKNISGYKCISKHLDPKNKNYNWIRTQGKYEARQRAENMAKNGCGSK
jgi:hypothetical protein